MLPGFPAAASQDQRHSLNGCWILDRKRGNPSMRGYLETMGVNELAIQAHEKGEAEHNTYHTITLDDKLLSIVKRSRVNNDLRVQLELGKELVVYLPPGNREKKSIAVSAHPGHVEIRSSLLTVNGRASVVDIKNLQQEGNTSLMVQQLTVTNEAKGISHTTTRWFVPYTKAPPHLATSGDGDVEMRGTIHNM